MGGTLRTAAKRCGCWIAYHKSDKHLEGHAAAHKAQGHAKQAENHASEAAKHGAGISSSKDVKFVDKQ